jgi:hypothetical protein
VASQRRRKPSILLFGGSWVRRRLENSLLGQVWLCFGAGEGGRSVFLWEQRNPWCEVCAGHEAWPLTASEFQVDHISVIGLKLLRVALDESARTP